jgi:hypothetical protein
MANGGQKREIEIMKITYVFIRKKIPKNEGFDVLFYISVDYLQFHKCIMFIEVKYDYKHTIAL